MFQNCLINSRLSFTAKSWINHVFKLTSLHEWLSFQHTVLLLFTFSHLISILFVYLWNSNLLFSLNLQIMWGNLYTYKHRNVYIVSSIHENDFTLILLSFTGINQIRVLMMTNLFFWLTWAYIISNSCKKRKIMLHHLP